MIALRKAKAAARKFTRPWIEYRERCRKAPLYTSLHNNLDGHLHVREAAGWLIRAQDHGQDRGISYGTEFGRGFLPSYPETTGYIIPTFLQLARHYGDDTYSARAAEMAEWEAQIQMTSGAVMGGMYNLTPTPAIFNTGMVLLGWSALVRETGSARFSDAAQRAGRWLMDMQEADGNWIRGNSEFANSTSTVYNVKAAWGLAEAGAVLEKNEFMEAAVRNAEYAYPNNSQAAGFRIVAWRIAAVHCCTRLHIRCRAL